MLDFYDFLTVAVVCGCVIGAYRIYMQAKYPKSFREDERKRRREKREDTLIGGWVMLFIGIAATAGIYSTLGWDPWLTAGLVCLGIGLGLLVAHYLARSEKW
ncbi:MAG: hypothetical protein ACE5FW_02440 [Candidatus Aenigmatarchaeota archaeon]